MVCVRRALEQLGGEVISGTESVFDADDEGGDTFVGGEPRQEGGSTSLMLSCVRIFSQRLFWTVSSVHPNCRCVSLLSSFSLAFFVGIL